MFICPTVPSQSLRIFPAVILLSSPIEAVPFILGFLSGDINLSVVYLNKDVSEFRKESVYFFICEIFFDFIQDGNFFFGQCDGFIHRRLLFSGILFVRSLSLPVTLIRLSV